MLLELVYDWTLELAYPDAYSPTFCSLRFLCRYQMGTCFMIPPTRRRSNLNINKSRTPSHLTSTPNSCTPALDPSSADNVLQDASTNGSNPLSEYPSSQFLSFEPTRPLNPLALKPLSTAHAQDNLRTGLRAPAGWSSTRTTNLRPSTISKASLPLVQQEKPINGQPPSNPPYANVSLTAFGRTADKISDFYLDFCYPQNIYGPPLNGLQHLGRIITGTFYMIPPPPEPPASLRPSNAQP